MLNTKPELYYAYGCFEVKAARERQSAPFAIGTHEQLLSL